MRRFVAALFVVLVAFLLMGHAPPPWPSTDPQPANFVYQVHVQDATVTPGDCAQPLNVGTGSCNTYVVQRRVPSGFKLRLLSFGATATAALGSTENCNFNFQIGDADDASTPTATLATVKLGADSSPDITAEGDTYNVALTTELDEGDWWQVEVTERVADCDDVRGANANFVGVLSKK